MKLIKFISIFIFTLSLNASFLSDKDKLIVTHPYFEKDGDSLYSYFGVEEDVKDKKKSYIVKFNIKKNEIVKYKKLDDIDFDIKGNIQSIKYKDKEAYIVFLTNANLTNIIIFGSNLEILYKKEIKSKVKNSGTIVDINNDGLSDIVFQTNDTLYLLLKNIDDEGFIELKDSLDNKFQDKNYVLYTRLGKPFIIDNGRNKFMVVYYTQYSPKYERFKDTYLASYEYKDKKLTRDSIYLLNKLGHRSKMDVKNINNKVHFTMPLDRDFFEYGELSNKKNSSLKLEKKGNFREGFYSSDSMKYFHEISHKIINFKDEAYYLMLDKSGKYEDNKLYIARLGDGQVVKVVDKYIPYKSIKSNSPSFRTSIDLSLIFNIETNSYDTYLNYRINNYMEFVSPINENKRLKSIIYDISSKYIFATENNTTYMLGYNKKSIFSKKLSKENIEFAPFENYNNLLNETNYIISNNTLKNIIDNLTNMSKNEIKLLYEVSKMESFNELYKKLDTIKVMLKYQKVDNIDEKLYNYFSKEFQNDKDNLIFNSIFIDKVLSSFNHSFENYFDNLNKLKELDELINDKRVKKLQELYINCSESFRLYVELRDEDKQKINGKFKKMAKLSEYSENKPQKEYCRELLSDIINFIKDKKDMANIIRNFIYIIVFIILIFISFFIYKNRIQIKIWLINIGYRKKQFPNFKEFYLLNGENLFNYLKIQNIENDYRKFFLIEDEYFEKTSKLQISNKTSQYFIDTFYTNLIMIYNKEPYRNNDKLEIKTDEAFIFALSKLEKLLQLQYFENYFSLFEACCQFIYIDPNENKNLMKKFICLKENMLLDEFKEIKINLNLQNYFIKKYKLDGNYIFSEKSKILKFLFNYIDIDNLKEKIILLNNVTFEKENISELKDKYLITSLQSDKSILKTFQALSLKDNVKVIIRYYDKNSNYNYVLKAEKGIEYNKVKFVDMYEFIEGKEHNISIEYFAKGEALPKLIKNKNISDFKIKDIIKRLIDYVEYLIGKENIKYLPNLHPLHLFYDKKSDKLLIVCNGHNKVLIDKDIIINNKIEVQEFFQTPEFRKYKKPNNLMNSIIKDIGIGNTELIKRELVYQIAMTLYAFLQGKLPFKEENIKNENYKIKFNKNGMQDSEKLEELLNSVLDTNPSSFMEIYERLSLNEFKLKLRDIYFNNINPFEAGRRLNYENYREVIIKRDKTISEVIDEIIKNKSRNFFIQSNKRMGKSTFLSQIEYEIKYINNKKIYAVYIVLNEMNFDKPPFFNIANGIYKVFINEDIKTYYKSPNLKEFKEQEIESFIEYIKYIIERSGKELVLLIDEFEDTLITLYNLHQTGKIEYFNYNYIISFKNIVDKVDGVYNFLVSSVDFKLLKDKTVGFNPESLNNVYPIILPTLIIDETKELMNNEKIINDGLTFSDELIEEVFKETNGHPLFIQNICHEIIEFKNRSRDETYEMDKKYFEDNKMEIYEKLFKSQENAFKELWDIVLTENEREILKDIVKNRLDYSNIEQKLLEVLEDSFLIKEVAYKHHIISIPIFKEWIEKNKLRFDND